MVHIRHLLIVACAAAAVAGCQKVQAKAPPSMAPPPAPLVVPTPPGRLIIPVSVQPEEVVDAPAPAAPASSRNTSGARNPDRTTTTPPVTPPPVIDPPPLPVQTTQNPEQIEQHARQQLTKASSDLALVQYEALSAAGRAQYDEVRRFIREAERAIGLKNYVFADELAKKAALLASLLVKRGGVRS